MTHQRPDDPAVQERLDRAKSRLDSLRGDVSLVDVAEELAETYRAILADARASTRQRADAMWEVGYMHWLVDLQEYDRVPPWVFLATSVLLSPHDPGRTLALASEAIDWLGKDHPATRLVVTTLLTNGIEKDLRSPEDRERLAQLLAKIRPSP